MDKLMLKAMESKTTLAIIVFLSVFYAFSFSDSFS